MQYQMSQPSSYRKNQQFLNKELGSSEGIETNRSCTDVICLIVFILLTLAFFGLFIYGMIKGNPSQVFTAYNGNGIACETTAFKFGFLVDNTTLLNAVCVRSCPDSGQTVQCLPDGVNCPLTGLVTSSYDTFDIFIFCAPDQTTNGTSITQALGLSTLGQWAYDIQFGYTVILAGVGAAMVITFIYIGLLRCCTSILLWMSIVILILSFIGIGIVMILEGFGVSVSPYLPTIITNANQTVLFSVGGSFIGLALIFMLVICCMFRRIEIGIAVVKASSIYLADTCQVLVVPMLTSFLMTGFVALLLVGAIFLYSSGGAFDISGGQVFATISVDSITFILIIIYGCSGLWFLFFIHGCNTFTLNSAAVIWYWNHASSENNHSPVCSSIRWLTCYHIGTIALSSLLFSVFFLLRLIIEIFDVRDDGRNDNCCLACCFKSIQCCLCLCNLFLRFLSEGMYVQVAYKGTGYCTSTLEAFDILSDNSMKLTLTSGISFLVTLIGVLTVTAIVCIGTYFAQIYIPQLAEGLTNPIPNTIIAGAISFVIAVIFLSLIGVSSSAIIQCYIIDQRECRKRGMYAKCCPENLRELFETYRIKG